jgi:hypothetical protein
MKFVPLAAMAGLILSTSIAFAQDTTVIERKETTTPNVTVEQSTTTTGSVGVDVDTGSTDCSKTTVRKEDGEGNSVTKSKTNCP